MTSKIEITVPESWADVTVEEYQKLDFEDTLGLIAILCGMSRNSVAHLTEDSCKEMLGMLEFIHRNPQMSHAKEVAGYKENVDMEALTLGELEILENLCQDFTKNAAKVCAFVYRGDEGVDPASLDRRAKEIAPVMMTDQMWGMVFKSIVTAGILTKPDILDRFNMEEIINQ